MSARVWGRTQEENSIQILQSILGVAKGQLMHVSDVAG